MNCQSHQDGGQGGRIGHQASKKTARDMDDFEIKIGEVEPPSALAAVEVLDLKEVCQVLVISEDLYRERGSVEIMSLGFEGMDDGKEFTIIDIVVMFCWDEGLIEARMPVAVCVSLEKDYSRNIF